MGFDKTKALNAAEKFLSQGKIPSAIQEYRKIVERDAGDFTALNTLGDLYIRTNKPAEAMACFLRVAEHYREQGFSLKAIAMYKKVSRLDPQLAGIAQHLARLYEQQGLYVEARAQYLTIADAAQSAGRAVESLEALRRIADLDPKNVAVRTRLADGYTREGMTHEAAGAYTEAGALLLAANKSSEALDAYRHAHKLAPSSHAVLHGLVAASTAVGASAEAARVLEESVAAAPSDLELRAMLARAYVEAEDAPAAERATDALVTAEHTNYPLWFEVARLYLKKSQVAEAVRVLARAVELALTGKQERAVIELLNSALAIDPEQIDALRIVLRIRTWQRDDEGERETLERLADAARKHGQADEEKRALEHLVRLVPFDQGYHERLARLGGDPLAARNGRDESASADDEARASARRTESGETEEHDLSAEVSSLATPARESSAFESAAFESFADVHDAHASTSAQSSFDTSFASASDSFAQFETFGSEPATPIDLSAKSAPGVEFEWNSVASGETREESAEGSDERKAHDERASAENERGLARFDPSASFADLNADFGADAPAADSPFDSPVERNGFDSPHAKSAFAPDADAATPADSERVRSVLRQELESVDFYLEQGYADIARDTLDMLERQYGAGAEIADRRTRLGALTPAPAASHPDAAAQTFDEEGEAFIDLSGVEYSQAERAARGAEEFSIDEQAFVINAEERTATETDEPTPAQLAAMEIALGASESASQPQAESRPATDAARTSDPQLASFFGEFLDEDSSQVPASHDDDFETHYNLGVAYKEMCLWDEAVEQFQKAYDLTGPADGTTRYLECCNMLGHCLAQNGMPRAAVLWFQRALALPALNEDESQALRYDLAGAYEQAGDIDHAIDTFSEVYGTDVSYRGVAERLRELQSRAVTSDR